MEILTGNLVGTMATKEVPGDVTVAVGNDPKLPLPFQVPKAGGPEVEGLVTLASSSNDAGWLSSAKSWFGGVLTSAGNLASDVYQKSGAADAVTRLGNVEVAGGVTLGNLGDIAKQVGIGTVQAGEQLASSLWNGTINGGKALYDWSVAHPYEAAAIAGTVVLIAVGTVATFGTGPIIAGAVSGVIAGTEFLASMHITATTVAGLVTAKAAWDAIVMHPENLQVLLHQQNYSQEQVDAARAGFAQDTGKAGLAWTMVGGMPLVKGAFSMAKDGFKALIGAGEGQTAAAAGSSIKDLASAANTGGQATGRVKTVVETATGTSGAAPPKPQVLKAAGSATISSGRVDQAGQTGVDLAVSVKNLVQKKAALGTVIVEAPPH